EDLLWLVDGRRRLRHSVPAVRPRKPLVWRLRRAPAGGVRLEQNTAFARLLHATVDQRRLRSGSRDDNRPLRAEDLDAARHHHPGRRLHPFRPSALAPGLLWLLRGYLDRLDPERVLSPNDRHRQLVRTAKGARGVVDGGRL